jgi:hypothetical protein
MYREILLSSIKRKLRLEGQIHECTDKLAQSATDSEQFEQGSDQKDQWEKELKDVEERIVEAAKGVLDRPLCLIEIPSDRTFLKNLEEARDQYFAGNWEQAYELTEQVKQAVEADKKHQRSDEGLVWLFRGGIAAAAGARLADPQRARDGLALLSKASVRFSLDDFLYRTVAQVIAGNARRAANGRQSAVLSDYAGALDPLEELIEDADKRGNSVEVQLYRALEESLNHIMVEVREAKADVVGQASTPIQPVPPDRPSALRLTIPLYGTIGASEASPLEEQEGIIVLQQTETGALPRCQMGDHSLQFAYLSGKTTFNFNLNDKYVALKVKGYSMDKAGIDPGDYVVLQKADFDVAESEDIVAVVFLDYDDRATLKQIHFDSDQYGRSTAVVFKPVSSNPIYRDRVFSLTNPDTNGPLFQVVGVARAVLKPMPVA